MSWDGADRTLAGLLRLNIGCGTDRRDGYVNIDLRRDVADIVADAGRLPFADGSVGELMAFDLFEHVSEWENPRLLAEWFRVLASGGHLVLRLPNLQLLAAVILQDDVNPDGAVRNVYGGHRYGPDGAWDTHHFGWTPASLAATLARGGFRVLSNDGQLNMTVVAEQMTSRIVSTVALSDFKASVIISTRDRADSTFRCLQALSSTDAGDDFELILVDNDSTDATRSLLAALGANLTVVQNEGDLGYARAANQGAARAGAQADVLVFLDNDTQVMDGWLSALLGAFDGDGDVGVIGGLQLSSNGRVAQAGMSLIRANEYGYLVGVPRYPGRSPDDAGVRKGCDLQAVSGSFVAVRRRVFEEIGGFDEGYWNGFQDVDLCLRARGAGYRVRYEPAAAVHVGGASPAPSSFDRGQANFDRLFFRWSHLTSPDIVGPELFPEQT
jgi:GT2 family glycosyltransferase